MLSRALLTVLVLFSCTGCASPEGTATRTEFDELWNYSQPAQTEQAFQELLPAAREAGDSDFELQLLTQIARSQGLQGHFDRAHGTLDEVESRLGGASGIVRVRYLLERGRVFNSSGDPTKAKALFERAFELDLSVQGETYTIDAAHMLAIVEEDAKGQLHWNLEALRLTDRATTEKGQKWRGSLYNNMGWTWHEAGEYAKALELFEKALIFREQQGHGESTRIAKWSVARALRSLQRYHEALEIQRALLVDWTQAGGSDGYVFEELGELLLLRGETEAATERFGQAWDLLSKDSWMMENEKPRMERMRRLAGR